MRRVLVVVLFIVTSKPFLVCSMMAVLRGALSVSDERLLRDTLWSEKIPYVGYVLTLHFYFKFFDQFF